MSATPAALIELERLAAYTQSRSGLVPEWAPRPRMPWEIAAHTNFAAIDRIMVRGYTLSAAHLAEFKAALIHDLSSAVGGETERRAIQWRVSDWVAGRSGRWAEAAAQAVDQVNATLVQTAAAAGRQLMTEAAAQGVTVPLHQAIPAEAALRASAELPVTATQNIIRQAATLAAQRPGGKDAITDAVDKASVKPAEDLARQGVNIAHGEGRAAVADDLPAPTSIHASELLDSSTCSACEAIDGEAYETLDAAYSDYPNAGTYINCEGGARCRGTLVLTYGETAPGDGS